MILKEQNKLFWLLLAMSIMFIAIYTYETIYLTVDFKRIDETIEGKYVIMHIEWKEEEMAVCGKHHKELTDGKGKCSVPMWQMGLPAGFCDKDAFGNQTADGGLMYSGYVPYLACPIHGGPECPGVEIEPSVFSGCDQSSGNCPVCGK